jgi:DNA-binding CsgD family transcriptional regulator/tetratricopeptide (TPR) repeat protein
VHHRLLAAALGSDPVDVESLLREAVQRQLLVTDGDTYAFRHALLQEAVYGDLLPGERVRTHATFARLLAEDGAGFGEQRLGRAAELAHHLLASHDLPRALSALVQAAGEAEKVAAPAEALRHIDQALAILDRVPEVGADRWALLLRAAAAAAASGDPMRAISLAREAAQLPGTEPARAAEAHERLAHLMLEGDQCGPECLAAARRALELAPVDPPTRVRAKAIAVLARVLANTRDDDECEQMCALGEQVAAAAGAADVAADLTATRAVLASRGDGGHEVDLHAAAVAAAEAAGGVEVRLRAIRNYGWALYDVGDITKAIAIYDDGIDLAQRSGLLLSSYGTELLGQLVSVLVLAGRWDEALERASVVHGSDISATTWVDASVASVLLRRGDPGAAAALQALRTRGMDDTYVGAELRAWSAVLAAASGDIERARQEIADALRQSSRWHWQGDLLLVHRVGAEIEADVAVRTAGTEEGVAAAAAARGHAASAAALIEALPRTATPAGRVALARAQAEAARAEGTATTDLWRALYEGAGADVYEQASAGLRLAEALLDAGERGDETVTVLKAVIATGQALDAAPLVDRASDLARRGRLDAEVGVEPAATADAVLTPRELEVLRLVAEGLSNRQVGKALFISEKTASVHVSNILSKLGAASRTEAAAVARRRGLLGSAA